MLLSLQDHSTLTIRMYTCLAAAGGRGGVGGGVVLVQRATGVGTELSELLSYTHVTCGLVGA